MRRIEESLRRDSMESKWLGFWSFTARVCSIESVRVNVLLRLRIYSIFRVFPPPMTSPNPAFRRPPGPDDPVALGIDPGTLAALQSLQAVHGDMVSIRRPNGRLAYFVNNAAEVRRMLTRRHTRYIKGPGFERVKMLLGNGLIVSDADVWRRSRTMIQPAFTPPERAPPAGRHG